MKAPGAIMAGLAQEILLSMAHLRPRLVLIGPIAGVSRAALDNPEAAFPLATFTSILETAAAELADSTFGLSLGQRFKITALGPIGALMQAAPSVGDAIAKFVHYFTLIQTNTKSMLAVSGGVARLSYAITDNTVRCRMQDANFTIAMEHAMLRYLLGPAWKPLGIELEHAPGDRLAVYQQHFNCPLRFNSTQNAISFPAELLSVAPHAAQAMLYQRLEAELAASLRAHARQLDLVQGLEAWMGAAICHASSTDIAAAAVDFGLSVRSFQRHLQEQGVNYAALRNGVRLRMSQCLLTETEMPVTSIGARLGYSETSAFSRAFRAQTGRSPLQYREARER
jgi:AraC-like DNA-binding protein